MRHDPVGMCPEVAILQVQKDAERTNVGAGELEFRRFRLEGHNRFPSDARGHAPGQALDRDRQGTGTGKRGQLHCVVAMERAVRARVPDREVAEHWIAQVRVLRQHGVERVLVVADEAGPALHAPVEIVVDQDAIQGVEEVQGRW